MSFNTVAWIETFMLGMGPAACISLSRETYFFRACGNGVDVVYFYA